MLSPEYLKDLPENVISIFEQLEEDILADISRRISKGMELTETANYQISVLAEMGYDLDDIKKEIAQTMDKSVVEVEEILSKASFESYYNDMEFYKMGGKSLLPLKENIPMVNFINGVIKQTKGEFKNLTNTLGFVDGGGFKSLDKMYRDTLDYAVFQVSSGTFDYNTVLRQSVKKLADSGVRSIDYKSGVRNHLDVAVRRALMTGATQITGRMSLMNAEMMGQDLMEITAHAGARPTHQVWQGQIVSLSGKSGYLSLTDIGYGEVAGFQGANCRHGWFPYFEGISKPTYTKEQLENIDPPDFEYEGRTYTAYEASQKQRQIERAIRKTKRELIVYDNAGLKDDFTAASIKLRRQREFYKGFSKKANLRKQVERTGVYGYNKSISSKSVWAERKSRDYL